MAPNVQLRSSASESNECLRNEDNDPFLLDWSPCSLEEHLKKANCKRNPSCVFGLGENSPEGVLQVEKMAKKLHETAIQGRKNEEIPFAGLRNLGATCYANVVLQFLFFLRPFREAILNIDTDLSQYKNSGDYEHCTHSSQNQTNQLEKSIMELQLLFATLLKGHGSCVSPKKFLEALDLTTFVEQDIQEFVNLLLSLVEKYLHNSPTKTYETLISDVFQGSRRFVTTCHSCGQVSEASKTDSSFTELQVSAYHPGSIEDALSNMVMEELLTGDNQYLCEFCNGKRDASRKMVFDKLPPVLMLQLLRTTFDLTSGEKRKTHAKVSFPLEMDVHELLNMDTNEVKTYRLKAICFHRGSSAYCGHYTVQLFDDSSNKWFEFDDAQVKCCVSNSSAWKSDSPSGNGLDSVSNERRKRAKLRLFDKSANGTTNRRPTLSSTSACLLVYVLSDNMYRFGDLEESRLPDLLQDIINLENSELDIAFEVEKASVDSKVSEMERQKSEYLSLLPKLSARTCIETSDLVSYGYIPTSWLREWVKVRDGSMMPIDCSPYICEHGGLNPQSIIHVKRVAQEAFDWLIEKYGANSLLLRGPQCHCMVCVDNLKDHVANAEFWKQRNDEFTSYLMNPKDNINVISEKKDLSPNCPVSYIEKNFFKRWKKLSLSCKHGVDFVRKLTKLVKEFSLSRYCVHEKLIVEDWKEISCSLGKHLYDLLQFLSRDTEVRFDYFIVFQNDSHATFCDECHEKSTEMKEEISSIRQLKRLEKASLGELMKPKYSLQVVRFLVQQMKYRQTEGRTSASNEESRYLISSSWFEKWSDYLLNNGKRPEISPLEGLICEHNLLLYDLSTADDLFDRRVLCVSASCWEEIVKAYIDGYFDVNGVKLELKEEMDGCCKGVFSIPNCYDCMKKRKDPENKDEIELVLIKVNEMEQVQDKRYLSLDSLELYSTCIKSEMMTTRRSRVLRVQCNRSNSISELKLIIFQYLDIAPVAQELYLGKGMSLVHASSSLKDYNISDGSLLFLYIDKSKIDNGSEDFCALPEDSKVELGFMGSQLFGL